MKKALLIVTVLALALGASSVIAEQTHWAGTYWDPANTTIQGTWTGILFVNEPDGSAPYFQGEWFPDDGTVGGTLYASLYDDGSGVYPILESMIYDSNGEKIGWLEGYFDLSSAVIGHGEGRWKLFSDPSLSHYGFWKGKQVD